MPRTGITAIALAACAWMLWLLSAPWLPSGPADLASVVGSLICHQRPERSFWLNGSSLPVCARCAGIYAGAAAGAVLAFRWMPATRLRELLIASAIPTIVTLAAEWTGLWFPSNLARAVAGGALGMGLSLVVIGALATLHYGSAPSMPDSVRGSR